MKYFLPLLICILSITFILFVELVMATPHNMAPLPDGGHGEAWGTVMMLRNEVYPLVMAFIIPCAIILLLLFFFRETFLIYSIGIIIWIFALFAYIQFLFIPKLYEAIARYPNYDYYINIRNFIYTFIYPFLIFALMLLVIIVTYRYKNKLFSRKA